MSAGPGLASPVGYRRIVVIIIIHFSIHQIENDFRNGDFSNACHRHPPPTTFRSTYKTRTAYSGR